MTQTLVLETVEALKELGFENNTSILSDNYEELSYNFGNLKLSARRILNSHFAEIISVSGIYSTQRTITEIEIQLPLCVESIEQCAAFITWSIDTQIGDIFFPRVPTDWLEIGRRNFDTLPWVKEDKLYDARPQCLVDRDWLKLALRDLRLLLPQLEKSELLSFTFKNELFSINSRLKSLVIPANGKSWDSIYEINVEDFQDFPKRINHQLVEISIWKNYLYLANWRYSINKSNDSKSQL